MSEQLKHIFESSACLSKKQLRAYVNGTMTHEECYALEHHVNTCFFCSEALDGVMEYDKNLVAVDELNHNFLKDHFNLINPQIHLNSMAPAVSAASIEKHNRRKSQSLFRPSSVIAAALIVIGLLWFLKFEPNNNIIKNEKLAQQILPANGISEPLNSNITTANLSEAEKQVASQNNNEQKPQALLTTDIKSSEKKPEAAQADKGVNEATTQYKAPAKTEVAENNTIEKMPRNNGIASLSVNPAPSSISVNSARNNATEYDEGTTANDNNDEADEERLTSAKNLFEAGKYSAALAVYKKQMNSGSEHSKEQATLQAARCYINLGQKETAIKLLASLVNDGSGSQRRQAKRLLKDLEKEKIED